MKKRKIIGDYERYEQWFFKQQSKMAKKGLTMIENIKISKPEFYQRYREIRNDLKSQVNAGYRSSIGNIYQYLVREQAYGGKYETIATLKREGFLKLRKGVTIQEVATLDWEQLRTSDYGGSLIDWNSIRQIYRDLKAEGYTGKKSREWISQNIFGSP